MAKSKKKKKKSSGVPAYVLLIVLLLILVALIIGIITLLKKDVPRAGGTSTPVEPQTTAATEVTTTETEPTTTTTTEEPLPPGSVTGIELTFYQAALYLGDAPVMPIVTMSPEDAIDKSELWESSDTSVATVDELGWITPVGNGSCTIRVSSVNNPKVYAEVAVTVGEEASAAALTATTTAAGTVQPAPRTTATQSANGEAARNDIEVINGITYVQGILIANKTYGLPEDYNPGLDPEAEAAFNEMAAAAAQDGLSLVICSGFRSYDFQATLYQNYCNRDGQAQADRFSARPGHSEHQTGLAMDINYAGDSFNDTPEAKWIAENCWKYGFILRYPKDKEEITGYKYESWHVRYLGKEWAKKIYDSGLTLEEYFNLTSEYQE